MPTSGSTRTGPFSPCSCNCWWTVDPCVNNRVTTSVSTLLKPVSLASAAHWCFQLCYYLICLKYHEQNEVFFSILLGLLTAEVMYYWVREE